MAPIHHHFEQKGWSKVNYCNSVLDHCYNSCLNWSCKFKIKMIKSKIDKSFYILGLGISGLSTALFFKKKSKKVICWDDDNEKRKLAIENKLNVKKLIQVK